MYSPDNATTDGVQKTGALPWHYCCTHVAFETFCRVLFTVYCPLTTHGRELLPPPPFLICANHSSHMDTPALMTACGGDYNDYAMIAARDYFFSNNSLNRFRYDKFMFLIPIDRRASHGSLRAMFAGCKPHLKSGRNLIIYPEGTRSQDGTMAPMKRGAAVLALGLNLPVAPAHISGTFRCLPKGTVFPRPGRVRVRFGKPLMPADYHDDKQASRMMTNDLSESVRLLGGTGNF